MNFFFQTFLFLQRFRNELHKAKTRLGCRWADGKDTHDMTQQPFQKLILYTTTFMSCLEVWEPGSLI